MSAEIEKAIVKQELEKLLFRSKAEKTQPPVIKCPKCGSTDTCRSWGVWNKNCRKCNHNFNVPEEPELDKGVLPPGYIKHLTNVEPREITVKNDGHQFQAVRYVDPETGEEPEKEKVEEPKKAMGWPSNSTG